MYEKCASRIANLFRRHGKSITRVLCLKPCVEIFESNMYRVYTRVYACRTPTDEINIIFSKHNIFVWFSLQDTR